MPDDDTTPTPSAPEVESGAPAARERPVRRRSASRPAGPPQPVQGGDTGPQPGAGAGAVGQPAEEADEDPALPPRRPLSTALLFQAPDPSEAVRRPRRSASRPAGAPVHVDPPAERRTPAAEPEEQPAASPVPDAARGAAAAGPAAAEDDGPDAGAPRARRSSRSRPARRQPEAPADEPADDAPAPASGPARASAARGGSRRLQPGDLAPDDDAPAPAPSSSASPPAEVHPPEVVDPLDSLDPLAEAPSAGRPGRPVVRSPFAVDLGSELDQLRSRRGPGDGAAGDDPDDEGADDLLEEPALDDEDEADDGADEGPDDEAADDGPARRGRRRRGGRGRRRRAGADDADPTGTDPTGTDPTGTADEGGDLEDATASAEAVAAAEELDPEGPDAGDAEGVDDAAEEADEAGSRRRRRRRRRGSSGAEDDASGEAGAPAEREDEGAEDEGAGGSRRRRRGRGGSGGAGGASGAGDDTVTAIKGSTRLEAKRQRRRDGRDSGRRPKIVSEAEFLARREAVERTMVVRSTLGRTQIAVLEDGVLVEHYVARKQHTSMIGNVYLGKVQNVLPSMEAAFVDVGRGRNAVLYAGEVNWEAAGLSGQAKRIETAMSSGDPVLVQVSKDPVGHKGARLTSQVSLPGRYLVYVPGGSMTGISRKLPDTERTRLKKVLREVVPEDGGVIVRTAAEGASEEELRRDVERLVAQWAEIQERAAKASAPVLLHGEPDLTIKVVRDVFNEDFTSLVVDGEEAWSAVKPYIDQIAPDLSERVVLWDDPRDAFDRYRVDEQIAKALERKVWLPSGGSLVIDLTEAMTVVDVNTGRFTGSGGNLEETVTRNNLEAAEEIVRQLRLRDIGGIVVVDFIDMVLESNRDLVLRRLVECLGRDRTKHQVAEVTSLGLVQMTRKRVGQGLLEAFSETCEHCHGRGVVLHAEPVDPPRADDAGGGREGGGGRGRRGGRGSGGGEARTGPVEAAEAPEPVDEVEQARLDAARDAVRDAIHGVALASRLVVPPSESGGGPLEQPLTQTQAAATVAEVAAQVAGEVAADSPEPDHPDRDLQQGLERHSEPLPEPAAEPDAQADVEPDAQPGADLEPGPGPTAPPEG